VKSEIKFYQMQLFVDFIIILTNI